MIYWAQLFHFYQPPTQMPVVLQKICSESYKPLLKVFEDNLHARVTININGGLLEMLNDCGYADVVESFRVLGEKGEVEFTGSCKNHAILPLLPAAERKRQIELNFTASKRFLDKSYNPKGFFPPEMCYSNDILPEINASGYRWIILSGIACPTAWPVDKIYEAEHSGKKVAILFRDDILSNKISFKQIGPAEFFEHLKRFNKSENVYVVTAMDAETYGHHIKNWEELFLSAVYEQLSPTRDTYAGIKQATALADQQSAFLADTRFTQQVKMVTLSELLNVFPITDTVVPRPSSWSTTPEDMTAGNPYPLWKDKNNEIQSLLWEHLNLCIEMVNKAQECAAGSQEGKFYSYISRGLLDLALNSDQFWWASRRPMWDLNLIHLGLQNQWRVIINAYHAINNSKACAETKTDYYRKVVVARDIRNKIEDRLFIL